MAAIVCALQSPAISCLCSTKFTIEQEAPHLLESLQQLGELVKDAPRYQPYRKVFESLSEPCVPWMGMLQNLASSPGSMLICLLSRCSHTRYKINILVKFSNYRWLWMPQHSNQLCEIHRVHVAGQKAPAAQSTWMRDTPDAESSLVYSTWSTNFAIFVYTEVLKPSLSAVASSRSMRSKLSIRGSRNSDVLAIVYHNLSRFVPSFASGASDYTRGLDLNAQYATFYLDTWGMTEFDRLTDPEHIYY